jgi:hypothetical protein
MMIKPIPALFLVSALMVGGVGTAFAGDTGTSPRLPACVGGGVADGACLLPLRNGDFGEQVLSSWERLGLPVHGVGADGSRYAALPLGSGIHQAIYAHTGRNSGNVVYSLRFRVRAEHAPGQVHATLAMSTGQRTDPMPLGHVTSEAGTDGWSTVELSVHGRPYAAPAHVLVAIENQSGTPTIVQVDDVVLVESTDVELIGG